MPRAPQLSTMGSSAMDAMQVLFTAFDTGLSSKWREEDRSWRDEDRAWRCEDLDYRREEREWREQEKDMRELEFRYFFVSPSSCASDMCF